VIQTLRSAANNQGEHHKNSVLSARLQLTNKHVEAWFEIGSNQSVPDIHSPAIDWKKRIICGHPSHPVRTQCQVKLVLTDSPVPSLVLCHPTSRTNRPSFTIHPRQPITYLCLLAPHIHSTFRSLRNHPRSSPHLPLHPTSIVPYTYHNPLPISATPLHTRT